MVTAGDFRNGVTFEMDGQVYQIVEFQHVKPGKGAAFVRAKIKNVIQGSVVERTFNPTEKFPTAFIERKDMVYSYNDDGIYYFMDQETFDMVPVSESDLSDNFKFVKENDICRVLSYKGKVFGVEPPTFVTLEVTKTDPGFKGNTATNTLKPATLETGAEIRVPLFINEGDKIKGLLDGLDFDDNKKETKMFKAIIDVLENMIEDIDDVNEDMDLLAEQVDGIDDDLADVEDYLAECDDDCCDCDDCCGEDYSITCPSCGEEFTVDEDTVMEGGIECPACGEYLEFEIEDDDAEEAEEKED